MASTLTEALELKRAGFVGMRGKKSDSIEVPTDDFYENNPKMLYQSKRQGFVGMRGKKSMDHEDAVNELFAAQNGADAERYLKRAGFVGMRGKKGQRYMGKPILPDALQRYVRAGFVGMRG